MKNHPERDILSLSPLFLFVCLLFGLQPSIVVLDRCFNLCDGKDRKVIETMHMKPNY